AEQHVPAYVQVHGRLHAQLLAQPGVREIDLLAAVDAQREVERAARPELTEQERIVRVVYRAVPELLAVVSPDLEVGLKRPVEGEPGGMAAAQKLPQRVLGTRGIRADAHLVPKILVLPVPHVPE